MFKYSKPVRVGFLAVSLLFTACDKPAPPTQQHAPTFIETGMPALLSDWDVVYLNKGVLHLSEDVFPYDLNSALFTDYAHKLRTIWMPEGTSAHYTKNTALDFPVGTIISKTFYYPRLESEPRESLAVLKTEDYTKDFTAEMKNGNMKNGGLNLETVRLIETRILARRKDGWIALPYVWNVAQTEAKLKRIGAIQNLELVDPTDNSRTPFPYVVPNSNQCAGCHGTNSNTRDILPIGPKARHLNKPYTYNHTDQNQLTQMVSTGYLNALPALISVPKTAVWNDETLTLSERARAYLDINCSHCHSTIGPADTSGLHFEPETEFGSYLGVCKTSVSAGAGTGGFLYDIEPAHAERSILPFRMNSTDPGIMMPELGRSTIHQEGLALITGWIGSLDGACQK